MFLKKKGDLKDGPRKKRTPSKIADDALKLLLILKIMILI